MSSDLECTIPLLGGQRSRNHLNNKDLFSEYELPTSRPDVTPFAPGRSLEVDNEGWRYYAEDQPFVPRSTVEWVAYRVLAIWWAAFGLFCCRWRSRPHSSILGLPILSPNALVVSYWDGLMTFVDLTYTAFIVAISLAFDNITGGQFTWMTIADIIGTGFYLMDIIMGFHIGFVVRHDVRRHLVLDGWKVAFYYTYHSQFLLNLVACLPVVPEIITSAQATGVSSAYKLLYAIRLLRLVRVARLLRMVWGSLELLHNPLMRAVLTYSNTTALQLFVNILALAMLVNLLGCVWWFVAEVEGLEHSWAAYTALPYDLANASNIAQYMASVFFVMTTMTTNGYGDIHPVTVAEQATACLFMVLSVFYFGFVVNVVGDLLHYASRATRTGNVLRSKMEDMDMWMAERYLPPALKEKVRRYYVEVWAQHTGAGMPEGEYFEELPVALRGEIVLALAEGALEQSHMFSQLSHEVKAQLAASAIPVRLVAGHNLYAEGDDADSFFLLQEGEAVAIYGAHRTALYHSPALLGQAAVFASTLPDCQQRLHTVRAVSNCTLWQFPVRQLNKLARHNPDILLTLCQSYMQYVSDVMLAYEKRGRTMPQRLVRIQAQVQQLYDKISQQSQPAEDGEDVDAMQLGSQAAASAAQQQAQQEAPAWHKAWARPQPSRRERTARAGRSDTPHSLSRHPSGTFPTAGSGPAGVNMVPASDEDEDEQQADRGLAGDVLPLPDGQVQPGPEQV